jgi:hypothetical protein
MPFSVSRELHYSAPPSENGNRRPAASESDADATAADANSTAAPADD